MISLKRNAEKGQRTKRLQVIADKLVDLAVQGDLMAIREVADRIDGKPTQQLDHSSQDGTMVPVINVTLEDNVGPANGHDRHPPPPKAGNGVSDASN